MNKQIVTNDSPLPALGGAIARLLAAIVGGFLTKHGYMADDLQPLLLGVFLDGAAAGWALVVAYRNHKARATMTAQLPNRVALFKSEKKGRR